MQLDKDNEWIRLGDVIPWQELEHLYAVYFPGNAGRVAHSFREALGTLIIQHRLNVSDRKVVKAITEGPYLQYFIGLPRFQTKAPFSPSLLVEFRKRLNPEILAKCNETIIQVLQQAEEKAKDASPKKRGRKPEDEKPDENGNLGTAILDAACAPSDIRYPQDFSLLNEARVKLERMIDWFYKTYSFDKKPRTYRRIARKDYLALAKCKKRTASKVRATVRKMLGYVKRDLGYLDSYMADRIGVERFFSLGKRCSGMGLVRTRLEETSITAIALSVLVTNIFRHTAALNFFVFYFSGESDTPESYFALFEDEDEALEA